MILCVVVVYTYSIYNIINIIYNNILQIIDKKIIHVQYVLRTCMSHTVATVATVHYM